MKYKLIILTTVSMLLSSTLVAKSISTSQLQLSVDKKQRIKAIIAQQANITNPDNLVINSIHNIKNSSLQELYFSVKGNKTQNIIYITNDLKQIILGNMINIDELTNETLNRFNEVNKDILKERKLAKLKKEQEKQQKLKIFISDILNKKYGDLAMKIPGDNPNGEEIVLFTDPNCPYCKRYEKTKLPLVIKNSKSVRVVMFPIESLQGHDTSFDRSFWLKKNVKPTDTSSIILEKMHSSSNDEMKNLPIIKNKSYIDFVNNTNKMKSQELIQGTPSVFNINGEVRR